MDIYAEGLSSSVQLTITYSKTLSLNTLYKIKFSPVNFCLKTPFLHSMAAIWNYIMNVLVGLCLFDSSASSVRVMDLQLYTVPSHSNKQISVDKINISGQEN